MFGASYIMSDISLQLWRVSIYRIIHQSFAHDPELLRKYSMKSYIYMNVGAFIAYTFAGHIKNAIGYKYTLFVLMIMSLIHLIYTYTVNNNKTSNNIDSVNEYDSKKQNKQTNNYIKPIKHTTKYNKKNILIYSGVIISTLFATKMIDISLDLGDMPLINWVDKFVNLKIKNFTIPAESFLSINPIIIIILGQKTEYLLYKMRKNKMIDGITDLMIGMIIITLAMFCFIFMQYEYKLYGKNSVLMPCTYYITSTIGEVICSPLAISYQTLIIPSKFIGIVLAMGKIVYNIGNKLLTVIPHKSFNEKNLMPTFYLGFSMCMIFTIYTLIIHFISKKHINQIFNKNK